MTPPDIQKNSVFLYLPLAFILTACSSSVPSFETTLKDNQVLVNNPYVSTQPLSTFQAPGFWDEGLEASASGAKKIIIDKKAQRAYYYIGSQLVAESPVSTGKYSSSTPAGAFHISMKNQDHVSLNYGSVVKKGTGETVNGAADLRSATIPVGCRFKPAPMPYFMRVNGPVGMHEGFLPGYPASHGCIRLPHEMAKKFFEKTPVGTSVIVR